MENTKKAFLVTIAPTTRVVVDTKGKSKEQIEAAAIRVAIHNMWNLYMAYLNSENLESISEDIECPAEPDEPITPDAFC